MGECSSGCEAANLNGSQCFREKETGSVDSERGEYHLFYSFLLLTHKALVLPLSRRWSTAHVDWDGIDTYGSAFVFFTWTNGTSLLMVCILGGTVIRAPLSTEV